MCCCRRLSHLRPGNRDADQKYNSGQARHLGAEHMENKIMLTTRTNLTHYYYYYFFFKRQWPTVSTGDITDGQTMTWCEESIHQSNSTFRTMLSDWFRLLSYKQIACWLANRLSDFCIWRASCDSAAMSTSLFPDKRNSGSVTPHHLDTMGAAR